MVHLGDTTGHFFGHGPVDIPSEPHALVIGGTGSGKTTLLKTLIVDDINRGAGCAVVDPHGDLARDLLRFHIPRHRTNDVIYIDPLDPWPIGLNPLEGRTQQDVDRFISIVSELYGENSWGGRSAWVARNVGYAVVEVETGPSPWNIYLAFMSEEYRRWLFQKVKSPTLRMFSAKFDDASSKRQQEEAAAAPMNKVDALVSSYTLRHIFGQPRGLDLYEAMARGAIILFNADRGRLGGETSNLLTSVFMAMVLHASLRRSGDRERPYCGVYCDEFHNMTRGQSHEEILSATRKYGVKFVVGDQNFEQMPEGARASLLSNCGVKIVGKTSAADAEVMAKEMGLVNPGVLQGLKTGEFYLQSGVGNTVHFQARRVSCPEAGYVPQFDWKGIVRRSRKLYGRSREDVERLLRR